MRVLTTSRPWKGTRIVLGVSGGIAAYKSVQLARDLTRLGAQVDTVLTRAAVRFVTALSFEGVTGRAAYTDLFSAEGVARHIGLGRDADVVVVAPATADLMARAAEGRGDDLLTTTLLATRAPVLFCPAMNHRMWAHPQTRANAERLTTRLAYRLAGPAEGPLAAGEESGPGRMLEPSEIADHVGRLLGEPGSPFAGKHVLVTSGPTREPLDPVRFVGNRSSGRMGHAVASAAWKRGAQVTLVSGPVSIPAPTGVRVISVETASEMRREVEKVIDTADVTVFAAAVADYRPAEAASDKVKRATVGPRLQMALVANPDIAACTRERRRPGAVTVGFALETADLLSNARRKLEAKGFDMILANAAGEPDAAFESTTNRGTLLAADGSVTELPLQSKEAMAEEILDRVADLLESQDG